MRAELERYLDGEIAADALSERGRGEARAWDALLADVRRMGAGSAPAGLERRVMRAVRAEARPAWRRWLAWWVRPRPVPVSPLAAVAGAAALALLVAVLGPEPETTATSEARLAATSAEAGRTTVYVQFVLRAPDAGSVAVAGDFNGWRSDIVLEDRDGDGLWTGRVALSPGVHEYMFLVDGVRWVTDPYAERYADDGFGNRNAVLAIAPSPASDL